MRTGFPSWFLLSICLGACAKPARVQTPALPPVVASRGSAPPVLELYTAEAALDDALSESLEYVGTGQWHGTERTPACVFRNARVFVVNVYCTPQDAQAVQFEVFSPLRGFARIYAESKGLVSGQARASYFTFMVENEPAPRAGSVLGPLRLAMSFAELRAYDERRYSAFLPACYVGTKFDQGQLGCLGALKARAPEWAERNRAFVQSANGAWYSLVRTMRSLAVRYGAEPR
ncbi:MAG: hypothetical protein QM778_29165 [Myxococcales bacterium]